MATGGCRIPRRRRVVGCHLRSGEVEDESVGRRRRRRALDRHRRAAAAWGRPLHDAASDGQCLGGPPEQRTTRANGDRFRRHCGVGFISVGRRSRVLLVGRARAALLGELRQAARDAARGVHRVAQDVIRQALRAEHRPRHRAHVHPRLHDGPQLHHRLHHEHNVGDRRRCSRVRSVARKVSRRRLGSVAEGPSEHDGLPDRLDLRHVHAAVQQRVDRAVRLEHPREVELARCRGGRRPGEPLQFHERDDDARQLLHDGVAGVEVVVEPHPQRRDGVPRHHVLQHRGLRLLRRLLLLREGLGEPPLHVRAPREALDQRLQEREGKEAGEQQRDAALLRAGAHEAEPDFGARHDVEDGVDSSASERAQRVDSEVDEGGLHREDPEGVVADDVPVRQVAPDQLDRERHEAQHGV
mmetsp:Transcript_17535/g.54369  ORF Transcript_17535/g.54369 Transcript_17535/m.54369 type:complete len:412 (-) Transcript_17535:601-1836(-)